jgi:phosphohistidine phosphatase SixA
MAQLEFIGLRVTTAGRMAGRSMTDSRTVSEFVVRGAVAGVFVAMAPVVAAQPPTSSALVESLQAGGHVLVMRHASSPREVPPVPNPDNVPPERQLDEKGRATAAAMGAALRRLRIPIGEVLTSPTYRARETARLARFPNPRSVTELGEMAGSMLPASKAQTEWLLKKVKEFPRATNTVLVTHVPNISAAFPAELPAVAEGEALVLGGDGRGGTRVVGRVRIEEWAGF